MCGMTAGAGGIGVGTLTLRFLAGGGGPRSFGAWRPLPLLPSPLFDIVGEVRRFGEVIHTRRLLRFVVCRRYGV